MNKYEIGNYILNIITLVLVLVGCVVSWTAMVRFNHGGSTYAVYAAIQAVVFVELALLCAVIRAGRD